MDEIKQGFSLVRLPLILEIPTIISAENVFLCKITLTSSCRFLFAKEKRKLFDKA